MKAAKLNALILSLEILFISLPATARAVELTTNEPATIYYTTNGADPTSSTNNPTETTVSGTTLITWNGAGADNLASNPANWSGSTAPLNNDDIMLDGTSAKDAVWDSYAIPASLILDQGYTGTVTLNSVLPVTGSLVISGGALVINGVLEIGIANGGGLPVAPTALLATPVSSARIDLAWTDNAYDMAGFKIERKTGSGGTYGLLAIVGASASAYSDTGLTAGTTYFYRVRAYNSSGDSPYSDETSATTATPIPPATATVAATSINGTSAVVNATVNPNGAETTVQFEWGPTTSYGNSTSSHSAGSGTSNVNESDRITGLSAGTTYHYRIVASNAGGTTSGGDLTFTTSTITLTINSPADSSSISRPDVMVTGTVTNPGGYETGVTVNGVVAIVYGNQFVANHVPLQEGVNVITATATDTSGNTAVASITVTATTSEKYIRLTADTQSGVAPLATTLRIDGSFSITNSTLNATGPVQPEIVTLSAAQYQVNMTAEGIYYFTANVTGPDGNPYQDTLAVVALNATTLDSLLRSKWTAMTTSLGN